MPESQLPNSAVAQIVWVLSELLYHREKVRLEEYPDEWYKLEQYAAKVRGWLENQPRAVIRLEEAVRQYPVHTVLHRRTIRALLDLREPSPMFSSMNPPDHCPACKQLLNGSWDCGYCGLEVENTYRHSLIRHESSQPVSHLPLFYVLLPDPQNRRVLILNGRSPREVVWEIVEALDVEQPVCAIMQREHRVLLADKKGNRVGEYGLFGDNHWKFNTRISNAHKLKEPTAISAYTPADSQNEYYLIVDQGNHRILSVDRQNQIRWEYGMRGEAGKNPGHLDHPAYAEYTFEGTVLIADTGNGRLLEIQPNQNNVLAWNSEEQLELIRPCFAHRLHSGNTLIVDPGAYKVIEVDRNGTVVQECIYYHEDHDIRLKIDHPHTVIRLPNQHVLIADETSAIEINLPAKTLVWSSLLSELNFPLHQALEQTLIPNEELVQQMEKETALQLGHFDLETALKRVKMFEGATTEFYFTLKQYLTEQHYQAGEMILKEGDEGDSMYLLASGRVTVCKNGKIIATLQAGEIFGEMALVLQQRRSADVLAAETCKVYKLKRLAFETVLQAYPVIQERIRQLAESRQGMSKINALVEYGDRLKLVKSLLQEQYERVASIKEQMQSSIRSSYLRLWHPDWRLLYTRIERHLIHEALYEHLHPYEIHVEFGQGHGGRIETALRLTAVIENLGTLIRIWPDVDALEAGKWEEKIVLTLLSPYGRDLVAEALHDLPEIRRLEIHSIYF